MTIVNLGDAEIAVGSGLIRMGQFDFKSDQAYCIYYSYIIGNANNIFSYIEISIEIQGTGYGRFWADRRIHIPIREGKGSFLYPFSKLYGNDGTARIWIERISQRKGTAEADSPLRILLEYDDDVSEKSWLSP